MLKLLKLKMAQRLMNEIENNPTCVSMLPKSDYRLFEISGAVKVDLFRSRCHKQM